MRHNLSEINKVIADRRTIYPEQFSDTEIDKDIIANLLKNATYAPSHGMTQPWCFKVFRGEGRQTLASFLGDFYTTHVPKELFLESKHKKLTSRPLLSSAVIAVGRRAIARLMIDFWTPCHKNRFASRRILWLQTPCVRLDYAQKPLRQGNHKWLDGYSG